MRGRERGPIDRARSAGAERAGTERARVDRSFVTELNGTPEGAAIAQAVVRLAQALHLTTVAEGIETTQQAHELQVLGRTAGRPALTEVSTVRS